MTSDVKVNLAIKRLVPNHPYFDGSRDTMLRGLPPANKLFGNKVLMGKIHIVLGGAGCTTSVCRGARTATSFFGIFNDTRSSIGGVTSSMSVAVSSSILVL